MAAAKICPKPNAKLASPAAFPRKFNHPVMYDENGAHLALANMPAQWYTLPAEGYEEQISAMQAPIMFEKTDPIIQPQNMTTGPPVTSP